MLNDKTEIRAREVEVLPEIIEIYFNEEEKIIKLTLPSAKEIADLRSKVEMQLSIHEAAEINHFDSYKNLKEVYDSEILKYEKYKDSSTYLTRLSNYCELFGDLECSKEHAVDSSKIDSSSFHNHEIAELFIKQGKYDDAKFIFSHCDLKKDEYANLRLAYFSTLNKNIPRAKLYIEEANRINPDNYKIRMFLGAIYLYERNWESAILNFRIASENNSSSSSLNVNLAAAYLGIGDPKKALKALKKAVKLNPLNENAINFLFDVYSLLNDSEKAIPHLEKYLEFEQKSSSIWERMARALLRRWKQA